MEYLESLLKQYSPALLPIYWTEKPNEPIQLYKGLLEIIQEETAYKGEGTVFLEWLPSPRIKFYFSTQGEFTYQINLDKARLNILEIEIIVEVYIMSLPIIFHEKLEISGYLNEPTLLGLGQDLTNVVFHLSNFHDFIGTQVYRKDIRKNSICSDRLLLEVESWSIYIDKLENFTEITESLQSQGGYAITHVGKIERSDQKTFSSKEAEEVLEVLHWFLSFCRGFRISPILLVGQNNNGEKVWEKWHSNQLISPWKKVDSWFIDLNKLNIQNINELFAGFLTLWKTDTWNDAIRLAIHWYLESNAQAGAVQGSIILLQAAFEHKNILYSTVSAQCRDSTYS
ncbi:hypothetical protein [Nostoc sp. FACHB-145]|uniref:hypothetical protein n=1 Tax=Nostoc sp. FACHB-145 TaxID=2692836 RepID=UPI001682DFFD|nr:hypothetical protein [Nostoc sp. FACHB-145]MBD2468821.1 hypothetical protein [Nostoc sp. FACHB-145]